MMLHHAFRPARTQVFAAYSIKQVEADPEPKKTGKVLWIFNNLFHRKDMGAKKGYGI